jgi:hypothetical protein
MNEHERYEEWLPLYVSGRLNANDRRDMVAHLETCSSCRADLALWQSVAGELSEEDTRLEAPQGLPQRALLSARSRPGLSGTLRKAIDIMKFQLPLVRRDLWPASAAMMLIGITVAVVADKQRVLYFIAPMIAATTLAAIYGPENDEANELVLATQTSPWKILLARLALVFTYNLGLGLAGSLALNLFLNVGTFWPLVLTWLAPMAFLSMLALVLSMWIGTGKSVLATYALWLLQYIPFSIWKGWNDASFIGHIQERMSAFWQNPLLLFTLAGGLLVFALLSSLRPGFSSNIQTAS